VKEKSNSYITTQEKLDHVVGLINQRRVVALDTEFTRRTTYYPILSIIQIAVKNSAGEKESFIVDCLADLDLGGLMVVVANKNIVKILHSCSQDLQILHKISGLEPQGIYDTQILANFCGIGFNVGYSSLVESLFQQKLNKKQQQSDWQSRPLSSGQIKYALLDVFFLEEIYEKLFATINDNQRLPWLHEEMERFVKKILTQTEDGLLKNFSFRNKNSRQILQIKKLISWREKWAQKLDVPRQHFLRDDHLEIIASPNFSVERFHKKLTAEMLDEVLEILSLEEDLLIEESDYFLNHEQRNLFKKVKQTILEISARENFREQFLLTSQEIKRIILKKNPLEQQLAGWRYELLGSELENLLYENHSC